MSDYHDYVFKNGVFIGAFEEMYRASPDPWHQDGQVTLTEELCLAILSRGTYSNVLDIGCGKGRRTARFKSVTRADVQAIDVSATAVRIAQERYPSVSFSVACVPPLAYRDATFDLVITADLLWYVLPDIGSLFAEIRRVLQPGGHYLITQQFYQPGEQTYGNEIMQSPSDLLGILPFKVLYMVEVNRLHNHQAIFLLEVT